MDLYWWVALKRWFVGETPLWQWQKWDNDAHITFKWISHHTFTHSHLLHLGYFLPSERRVVIIYSIKWIKKIMFLFSSHPTSYYKGSQNGVGVSWNPPSNFLPRWTSPLQLYSPLHLSWIEHLSPFLFPFTPPPPPLPNPTLFFPSLYNI